MKKLLTYSRTLTTWAFTVFTALAFSGALKWVTYCMLFGIVIAVIIRVFYDALEVLSDMDLCKYVKYKNLI